MLVRSRAARERVAVFVAASACGVLPATGAHAQTPQANATRRALLSEATAARDGGNHARALEIAEQAAQIRMSASLRMFIAEEQTATGHLAAALDNAQTCAHDAPVEPNVTDRATVVARCQSLARTLTPRVAHVVLHVTPADAASRGAEVHVGNDALGSALWGVPYVVDPSDVVITATRPGARAPFRREAHLAEGQTLTVDIDLDALGDGWISANATASTPPAGAASSAVPDVPRGSETRHPIGSYVVMGVGAAGVIAGGVMALVRLAALSGCETHTGPSGLEGSCDTVAHQSAANSTAVPLTPIAPITAIAGGVVLLGGAAWWWLGATHAAPSGTATWHPSVAPNWIGIEGRF